LNKAASGHAHGYEGAGNLVSEEVSAMSGGAAGADRAMELVVMA
jgi:hypothetical protein